MRPLPFAEELPAHAEVIEALRAYINASEPWRWFELSCSLAAGRGDALSDIDAGAGYAAELSLAQNEAAGRSLVDAAGKVLDVLVHQMAEWPPGAVPVLRAGEPARLRALRTAVRPGRHLLHPVGR